VLEGELKRAVGRTLGESTSAARDGRCDLANTARGTDDVRAALLTNPPSDRDLKHGGLATNAIFVCTELVRAGDEKRLRRAGEMSASGGSSGRLQAFASRLDLHTAVATAHASRSRERPAPGSASPSSWTEVGCHYLPHTHIPWSWFPSEWALRRPLHRLASGHLRSCELLGRLR
jgi:hypothetical protein